MLTIRGAQMEALKQVETAAAIARVQAMAARHWPEEHARLGPTGLRHLIRRAFAACARRGILEEADVARYLNVQLALGEGFEDDARYPWARAILDDPRLRPPARVARLCALVGEHLDAVSE